MLYFEHWRQSKRLPKKGDVIYVIPIRYWEPDEYTPEKFTVEKAYIQETGGRLTLYGQYEKEKPDTPMYAAKDCDAQWYWDYESARKVQLLLHQIYEVVSHDEAAHIVEKILREEFPEVKKRNPM